MRLFFLGSLLLVSLCCGAQTDTTKGIVKLKNELQTLFSTQRAGQSIDLSAPAYRLLSVDVSTNTLLINVIADADVNALRVQLQAAGIELVSAYERVFTCRITPAQLTIVNALPGCRWAQPVYRPRHRSRQPPIGGNVVGQGYAAMRVDSLRKKTGLTGAGVKVGVLSDSYNVLRGAAAGVAADELPGSGNPNNFTTAVTVVRDYTAADGTDEGRAMLEIVHDIAPAASLYFYTAYESAPSFANGILALANAGCKVIIDDIGYYEEPYFQDGIIAQAVDKVKANNGVTYFSAAGNSGTISYENAYRSSTYKPFSDNSQITAHNFAATGQTANYYLPITLTKRADLDLGFQWSEPFVSAIPASSTSTTTAGATTDMDIYLLRSKPTGPISTTSATIVARKTTDNIGADPLEILSYTNPNNTTSTFYLLITRYSASGNPARLKVIGFTDFSFPTSASAIVGINASTAYGHPNASGAIAVGAASYDDTPAFGRTPPVVEYYSSKGGIPVYFNPDGTAYATPVTRQKPEIVAPDNANTSFFGYNYSKDNDSFPNFAGTSAAAPHAGAVAALLLQARPTLTPDQVKSALQNTAIDMDDPSTAGFDTGFDFGTGYGLIQADRAYQNIASGTCSSMASGSWNSPATWSCGVVPGIMNEVVINAAHTVTVDGETVRAAKINYSGAGQIQFLNNGKLSFMP